MVIAPPDRHYTPESLADVVVGLAETLRPGVVADLAAGDGALLEAARRSWPNARFVAVDIDTAALGSLARKGRTTCIASDALALELLPCTPDVIFLNPPFSHRGGHVRELTFHGLAVRCSPAMAFLLKACQLVRPAGEIVAVMPANILNSEKDSFALQLIRTRFHVSSRGVYGRNTFDGCYPTVKLLHLVGATGAHKTDQCLQPLPASNRLAYLYRGSLPVQQSSSRGRSVLLHTTHLANTATPLLRCNRSDADLEGNVVLLPRVGACRPEHIVIRKLQKPTRLSECLFALWGEGAAETRALQSILRENYEKVEATYHGTCAHYMTIKDLQDLLRRLGWDTQVVKRGSVEVRGQVSFRKLAR